MPVVIEVTSTDIVQFAELSRAGGWETNLRHEVLSLTTTQGKWAMLLLFPKVDFLNCKMWDNFYE